MGWTAALRTRRSVAELRRAIAVEAVCAAQALDLRESATGLSAGPGTRALRDSLRARVAHLDIDRFLAPDLAAAEAWLASQDWSAAAEAAVGVLL
jgi:histidine ammonia-lyase